MPAHAFGLRLIPRHRTRHELVAVSAKSAHLAAGLLGESVIGTGTNFIPRVFKNGASSVAAAGILSLGGGAEARHGGRKRRMNSSGVIG